MADRQRKRQRSRGVVETVFYSGADILRPGASARTDGRVGHVRREGIRRENDPVRSGGHWEDHPKYGRQFAVEWLGHDLEIDPDGLANYLANHPDVKGIGPAKARLIADAFGAAIRPGDPREPEGGGRRRPRCRWNRILALQQHLDRHQRFERRHDLPGSRTA